MQIHSLLCVICVYDLTVIITLLWFQDNTFQCVLASSELESFVMFLYVDLQWTTGRYSFGRDGLGGTHKAVAGFAAGDRINYYTIPGSQTSNITNLTITSNVGIPGTWIFTVGQG